jgi:hypothetical protein
MIDPLLRRVASLRDKTEPGTIVVVHSFGLDGYLSNQV